MTSGFNLGALPLYSSAQSIWIVGGSLAPGLQLLGETENTPGVFLPGLAFLDTGADLYGGGFAAGRRVQLPWAGGATFDINALTNDGRTIMKRAIEWAAGPGGGGGGGGCDGTFRDEFNAASFSGSDGTLTWAGDWLEVGESNGADAGDIRVLNNLSNSRLRTRDNDNGGEGVEREADLTGAASATLSYDYRRMNLDGSSDYTSVEVSANGVAGPWTELVRHQGSGNDSSYQPASHNINGFISGNTRIRFKTSSGMGGTDTVWFDNIEIACTP